VADRYVSVSMTLSDPNPSFKVTKYLKNGASQGQTYCSALIGYHT